ncbi:hypothetical protein DBR06_SOUSAS3210063, partial [Sousa chinensis]
IQSGNLEEFTAKDMVSFYRIFCDEKVDQQSTFKSKINNISQLIVSSLSPELISQVCSALVILDQTLPLII